MTDRGVKHSTSALITENMFRALDMVLSEHQTGRSMLSREAEDIVKRAWLEGGGRAQLAMEGKQ